MTGCVMVGLFALVIGAIAGIALMQLLNVEDTEQDE